MHVLCSCPIKLAPFTAGSNVATYLGCTLLSMATTCDWCDKVLKKKDVAQHAKTSIRVDARSDEQKLKNTKCGRRCIKKPRAAKKAATAVPTTSTSTAAATVHDDEDTDPARAPVVASVGEEGGATKEAPAADTA